MKARVAKHYGVKVAQVVAWKRENGDVVTLIDYGVGGTKKFRLPLAELAVEDKFTEPKVAEVAPKAARAVKRKRAPRKKK